LVIVGKSTFHVSGFGQPGAQLAGFCMSACTPKRSIYLAISALDAELAYKESELGDQSREAVPFLQRIWRFRGFIQNLPCIVGIGFL